MRRATSVPAALVALLCLTGGPGRAQDKKPDATIEVSEGQVAVGIGWSWGSGTLTYKGKKHRVKVEGLSVGEVGIVRATARGDVFDLKKHEDSTIMKNQNSGEIRLTSTTQGASLKLAASGIKLTVQQ